MPTTGEKIKALRRRKNWTQYQLADKVGVSSQVISNMERSYTSDRLKPEVLAALAQALGTTIDYLVGSDQREDVPLSEDEQELLLNFRKLDERQQALASGLLQELAKSQREEV